MRAAVNRNGCFPGCRSVPHQGGAVFHGAQLCSTPEAARMVTREEVKVFSVALQATFSHKPENVYKCQLIVCFVKNVFFLYRNYNVDTN